MSDTINERRSRAKVKGLGKPLTKAIINKAQGGGRAPAKTKSKRSMEEIIRELQSLTWDFSHLDR